MLKEKKIDVQKLNHELKNEINWKNDFEKFVKIYEKWNLLKFLLMPNN